MNLVYIYNSGGMDNTHVVVENISEGINTIRVVYRFSMLHI